MHLPRARFSLRSLILVAAVPPILLWAVEMARRVRHYREQAAIQGHLEAAHRDEARRYRGSLRMVRSGFGDADGTFAEWEDEQAAFHARLRRDYLRAASRPWMPIPADLTLPFPWDRARDRDVLEAAILDLMDPANPDNAITFQIGDEAGRAVVLDEQTYRWLGQQPNWGEDERAEGLTQTLMDDWSRRNSGGPVSVAGLGFRRARVIFDDVEAMVIAAGSFPDSFRKRHPNAIGYLYATLPGYSGDGRTAEVWFSGGFGPHFLCGLGMAGGYIQFMSGGSRVIYDMRRTGSPLVAVVPAPWPSRLRRWGPVVVSHGISLLALSAANSARPRLPVAPDPPPPE
jgi:hypothetical protein